MKILVTGGTGLVGEALQRISKNNSIYEFVFLGSNHCDLTKFFDINSYFAFYRPDIVIHLASKVGGLYKNINENYSFLMENLKMHMNIIECCKKYNVKRLINILSTCVFPDKTTYPISSENIHKGPPHYTNEGYAYSKRMLHILTKLSDIECVNLIPTNLYGLNDNYNLYASHVIPALIHKMYYCHLKNENLYLKGSGNARRQFVFADDFAKIILHFIDCRIQYKQSDIIVSPDITETVSIKELANTIKNSMKFEHKIIFKNETLCKDDGQEKKITDSSELKKYISFNFTSLSDGLNETIRYFIKNQYESGILRL